MNRVIAPGDRVIITPVKKGITRQSYKATVIGWMSSGKLNVQPDGDKRQSSKLVNPDDVKKLADKRAT
ncbi:hypothetical protein [Spirosoma jeollabukense]